jgi:hypothetical protein
MTSSEAWTNKEKLVTLDKLESLQVGAFGVSWLTTEGRPIELPQ